MRSRRIRPRCGELSRPRLPPKILARPDGNRRRLRSLRSSACPQLPCRGSLRRRGDCCERWFPCRLKICCLDITHKSDVGGIALNLEYTYRVRQEAIAMLVEGPVFGAPVAFGQGGASIDIQHDSSLELAPLNTLLARRLIARTRVSRLLRVYRGEGA